MLVPLSLVALEEEHRVAQSERILAFPAFSFHSFLIPSLGLVCGNSLREATWPDDDLCIASEQVRELSMESVQTLVQEVVASEALGQAEN